MKKLDRQLIAQALIQVKLARARDARERDRKVGVIPDRSFSEAVFALYHQLDRHNIEDLESLMK